jgi:hypothetical protein
MDRVAGRKAAGQLRQRRPEGIMTQKVTPMTKKLIIVGLTLMAVALVAIAADAITGKWTMEQEGRGGGPARVTTFDFKVDGAKLTGTVTVPGFGRGGDTPPAPTATPIANGKVDGNNLVFDVTREMMGNSMTTKYECAVSGSSMKVKMTMPGFGGGDPMVMEGTAKKAN